MVAGADIGERPDDADVGMLEGVHGPPPEQHEIRVGRVGIERVVTPMCPQCIVQDRLTGAGIAAPPHDVDDVLADGPVAIGGHDAVALTTLQVDADVRIG